MQSRWWLVSFTQPINGCSSVAVYIIIISARRQVLADSEAIPAINFTSLNPRGTRKQHRWKNCICHDELIRVVKITPVFFCAFFVCTVILSYCRKRPIIRVSENKGNLKLEKKVFKKKKNWVCSDGIKAIFPFFAWIHSRPISKAIFLREQDPTILSFSSKKKRSVFLRKEFYGQIRQVCIYFLYFFLHFFCKCNFFLPKGETRATELIILQYPLYLADFFFCFLFLGPQNGNGKSVDERKLKETL